MHGKEPVKLEEVLGSWQALLVELVFLFSIALLDIFTPPAYHAVIIGIVLALLVVSLISLRLYVGRYKQRESEAMIDQVVDRLSEHLVEILVDAWQKKWPAESENVIKRLEENSDVKEVWVLTPDFRADLGCKKETVVENVCCNGKHYNYIYPEKFHKEFDELVGACDSHSKAREGSLRGYCLQGRRITPVGLTICSPAKHGEAKAYLYFPGAPEDSRVLEIPKDPPKYLGDLVLTFGQLWGILSGVRHRPVGPKPLRA